MGTQFSRRLSDTDRKRILEGIREARKLTAQPRKKGGGRGSGMASASSEAVRRASDAVLGAVLGVAASHNFFPDFAESHVFEEVLRWLLRLRADADFNGFRGFIREYNLDRSANPTAELSRRLAELIRSTEGQPDSFSVPVSNAAKAVLAEAATRRVEARAEEGAAAEFGRKLALLDVRTLVSTYLVAFITDFLASLMTPADPLDGDAVVRDAIGLTEKAARRVADRAVKRVVSEGKLSEPARIRDIVVEELKSVLERSSTPVDS